MTWVLVILLYVYIPFGGGVSMSATSIPGYDTREACVAASKEAAKIEHASALYCIPGPRTIQ